MTDDDVYTGPTVMIVCQGKPGCEHDGGMAYQTQVNGCPWCTRIYVTDDGQEHWVEPGNA